MAVPNAPNFLVSVGLGRQPRSLSVSVWDDTTLLLAMELLRDIVTI